MLAQLICMLTCKNATNLHVQHAGSKRTRIAGARRGILGLPGVREDVGVIGIHHDSQFINIVPYSGVLRWDVSPWGRRVTLPHKATHASMRTAAAGMLIHCHEWCTAAVIT